MSCALRRAGDSLAIVQGPESRRRGGELDRIRALLVLGAIALAFCVAGRLADPDATGTRFALDAARLEYAALLERQGLLRERSFEIARHIDPPAPPAPLTAPALPALQLSAAPSRSVALRR